MDFLNFLFIARATVFQTGFFKFGELKKMVSCSFVMIVFHSTSWKRLFWIFWAIPKSFLSIFDLLWTFWVFWTFMIFSRFSIPIFLHSSIFHCARKNTRCDVSLFEYQNGEISKENMYPRRCEHWNTKSILYENQGWWKEKRFLVHSIYTIVILFFLGRFWHQNEHQMIINTDTLSFILKRKCLL